MKSVSPSHTSGPAPRIKMKLAVAGAVVLVLAGGAAFYIASKAARQAAPDAAESDVLVTITARACEPNDLVVPAGRRTFQITNASDRAVEWEILDGVMVVEERENIAPGFKQALTAKLSPGEYAITCGLLSNPRGRLRVTPSTQAAEEAAAAPSPVAFVGPLAEYKVYLALEASTLVQATDAFVAAIKAGDLAGAQALYAPTRTAYKRIEPMAERFADLDSAIDARAADFEKREQDPAFTGFHRLEYGLFAIGSTEGLASFADKLQADVSALRQRVRTLQVAPDVLAGAAERIVTRIAEQTSAGEQNLYSHTDLSDFAANLEGGRKITRLLRPLAATAEKDLAANIDARFEAASATLDRFRRADGFVPYAEVSAEDRTDFSNQMRALADEIAKFNAALGLS
ncbi:MAG: iron uptake system protein EfeO [Rhodospirillales bacterium]|nr:iron uptake system protein EfeO [Rhodospirillales bacterium]